MIIAGAVCPHPPLLLRELNGGHDSAAPLRDACHRAIDQLVAAGPEVIAVVGGADSGRLNGRLPMSLRIADDLISDRWQDRTEWQPVAWDTPQPTCEAIGRALEQRADRIGLLVMADGSASRDTKAPGYLDERAHDFDTSIVNAIEHGDWQALGDLDADLATQLLAQGRAALHVVAAAMRNTADGQTQSHVHYLDDPFGVLYLVATWTQGIPLRPAA